jgi:hypothetical protein
MNKNDKIYLIIIVAGGSKDLYILIEKMNSKIVVIPLLMISGIT